MMKRPAILLSTLLIALSMRARDASAQGRVVSEAHVRATEMALAADSTLGRLTATPAATRVAAYLAGRLREFGVAPAFASPAGRDSAYFQRVPMVLRAGRGGRALPRTLPAWTALDTIPAERRAVGINVVGIVPGSDPALRDQVVIVAAHYDHMGVGPAVNGDSIYNGADDDASGVVAVLEAARDLAAGPAPKRTVIVMLTTGEEQGLQGTLWYMRHPVRPLASTVAELEVEMIGRPDAAAGGAGKAWLTGFERSDLGDRLAAAGVPIVADPHPDQHFFQRSDNFVFACLGIPAHTLSSFGLHADYHAPSDEVDRIDFAHLTTVAQSAVRAVRTLADGPAPTWRAGANPANDAGLCGQFQ
jgi:hypothetical protein